MSELKKNQKMRTKKIFLLLILIGTCLFQANSQPNKNILDISGSWKIKTGDESQYAKPGFDDSDWKDIQIGKNWETEGFKDFDGIAFYRKKISIPSTLKVKNKLNMDILQLNLGQIDDADIVYFNGKEIGHTSGWDVQRVYAIPFDIINWDKENLIAVRVEDTGGGGGMYAGLYQIEPFNKIANIVEMYSDNNLKESSKSNEAFSQTIFFRTKGKFEKLPVKLMVNVFNAQNGVSVSGKTYELTIGNKADSSFSYSFNIDAPAIYKAKYKLFSDLTIDTISNTTLLTYKTGDHTKEHLIQPIIDTKLHGQAKPFDISKIQLTGYLGDRLNANLNERLLKIDEQGILECFYNRPGKQGWVGEYAGKYLHATARAWRYSQNNQLKMQMDRIVDILLASQLPDGYLGTYLPKDYWTSWDVWAHKYDMLGLLSYYELTGYEPALQACINIGDLMCRTFGKNPGQLNIEEKGAHVGMASCSILEPMTELYRFTGNKKFLDFCNYIIEAYDHPNGAKIITTLNAVGKVNKTANAKAYEMMSNCTGIVKLYQLTGDPKLLSAMENAWNDISANRLYITGTSSKGEHFQDDNVFPADNSVNMGEGCVSTTWLQFSQAMYYLKGESKYIDEIEKTIYNHLFAAENPITGCVAYYTALQGTKPYRCNIMGHCCLASIPRGIVAIPELVYAKNTKNGCFINIYSPGTLSESITTSEGQSIPIKVIVNSNFPEAASSEITVAIQNQANFTIALRVPDWCKNFVAKVEGTEYKGIDGQYLEITRTWNPISKIAISMDLNVRALEGGQSYPGYIAIKSGTQVLAFDQSLNPTITDPEKLEITNAAISLLPSSTLPKNWFGKQIYSANALYNKKPVEIMLVPFAEAGQSGGDVRVWIKK